MVMSRNKPEMLVLDPGVYRQFAAWMEDVYDAEFFGRVLRERKASPAYSLEKAKKMIEDGTF